MSTQVSIETKPTTGNDVSPRALAIARQIDRLAPGTYSIRVDKSSPTDSSQWQVTIVGEVVVKEFKAFTPGKPEPTQDLARSIKE